MEMYRLGNIEVIPSVFFLRDGTNHPLCLEDSFGNLASIPLVFNEQEIQKQEDMLFPNENLGFIEQSFDVTWSRIYWEKGKSIKGLSAGILELCSFMFRES